MEHNDSVPQAGKEELQFNDFIRRGDDFMKISIYRNARGCYYQALETGFNDAMAKEKLLDCIHKIKKESKIIISIIIIAVIIFGGILLTMTL